MTDEDRAEQLAGATQRDLPLSGDWLPADGFFDDVRAIVEESRPGPRLPRLRTDGGSGHTFDFDLDDPGRPAVLSDAEVEARRRLAARLKTDPPAKTILSVGSPAREPLEFELIGVEPDGGRGVGQASGIMRPYRFQGGPWNGEVQEHPRVFLAGRHHCLPSGRGRGGTWARGDAWPGRLRYAPDQSAGGGETLMVWRAATPEDVRAAELDREAWLEHQDHDD